MDLRIAYYFESGSVRGGGVVFHDSVISDKIYHESLVNQMHFPTTIYESWWSINLWFFDND